MASLQLNSNHRQPLTRYWVVGRNAGAIPEPSKKHRYIKEQLLQT